MKKYAHTIAMISPVLFTV